MACRIPEDMLGQYPPSAVMGENQCRYFINKCRNSSCNYYRFKPNELLCQGCGAKRPRCGAKIAVAGSDACRAHTSRGVLSIYSLVAGRINEQVIEETLERDDRSVDQEIAIARILLSQIVENKEVTDSNKLKAIQQFLDISKSRKVLESGADLDIKMDDKTATAIRKRFKQLMAAFLGGLREENLPEDQIKRVMEKVRAAGRLAGRYTPAGNSAKPPEQLPGLRTTE
jgi:hypothetical protein